MRNLTSKLLSAAHHGAGDGSQIVRIDPHPEFLDGTADHLVATEPGLALEALVDVLEPPVREPRDRHGARIGVKGGRKVGVGLPKLALAQLVRLDALGFRDPRMRPAQLVG